MKTKFTLLTITLSLIGLSINAQTLVKEIRPGGGSSPAYLANLTGTLFFSANNGTNGAELWKSDGTLAGTVLAKDINSGSGHSAPYNLFVLNSTLYFAANNGTNGVELWKSDGTTTGTVMLKDINPGSGNSFPAFPSASYFFSNINNTLFFRATDGTNGDELWKTDGTLAGTVMVKDINAGAGSSNPKYLTNVNGTIFFLAGTSDLWKSDGTTAGTVLVASGVILDNLVNVNGTLFFAGSNGELWKSDGTLAGTVMVKDINSGSFGSNPKSLTVMNDTLYFQANEGNGTGQSGGELWKSDGTAAGTVLVKDIYSGGNNSAPDNLFVLNNTLFFSAADGTSGRELWKSNGTTAGTVLIKDINPGSGNSIVPFPPFSYYFTNINDTLFFSATNGTNGEELWKSDGTTAGTVMAGDINPGAGDSKIQWFTKINNTIYFSAESATSNAELWKYDGASGGTTSIGSLVNNSNISVFPNPTTGRFTIELKNKNQVGNVEVYNMIGERVYTTSNLIQPTSNEIDLSNSPKGIYFVKIYDGENSATKKIIVE